MNPTLSRFLAAFLLAWPLPALAGRYPCQVLGEGGKLVPGYCDDSDKKKQLKPVRVGATDEQLNQINPPPVASEQGAFGRKRGKSSLTGVLDASKSLVAGAGNGGGGGTTDDATGDIGVDDMLGREQAGTQAGDTHEALMAKLYQDRGRAVAGCADQPRPERCQKRAAEYYDKVIANVDHDAEGNKSLKLSDIDLGRKVWMADQKVDRLEWMARMNPNLKDRLDAAKTERNLAMAELHNSAGATSFHVVVMEEVEKERPWGSDMYQDNVGKNPGSAPARVGLGRSLLKENNAAAAADAFSEALARDPKNAEAFSGRAAANAQLGNFDQAYKDAMAALALNPNDKSAFATLKLTEGRVGAAGGVAGKAAGEGGTNEAGQSSGGGFSLGAFDAAASAAQLSNTSPQALEGLRWNREAQAAARMGDRNAALALAAKAEAAYPNNPYPWLLRARYLLGDGNYKDALAAAEAGLKISPKDKTLLAMKARAANRLRDAMTAAAAAELMLAMDGRDAEGLANLAHSRGLAGDRDAMMALLDKAVASNPAYMVSKQSALQIPEGSDMLFLFPGEDTSKVMALLEKAKEGKAAPRRFGVVAIASLIGGLLIGLGLLSSMAGPLTQRVRSAFTRITRAEPVMRSEDRAAAPVLEPPPAEAGLLRGQYRVVKQIGAGGMGLVFAGEDITLGRTVAIKKMRDELRLDRRERQRFVNEAKMVAALHHANIVDIYAIVEDNEDVYLVFEYVKGRTVHDLIGVKGALSWREALGIFRSMTAALEFAHGRNIIHRDLKPSNVMVDDEGYVKVMDFGIARMAKDAANKVSMTNTVVGTPPYMAPEQEQGVVRKESDVYALAICLYEMLTGKMPFVGVAGGMLMNKINMNFVKPTAMVSGLPPGIDEVFVKAFQADPDKRYASAREMLAALNDLPPATRPDSAPTSLRNLPGENS